MLLSFDNKELLQLYEKIVLIRRSEEKILEEYSKDEMKTPVHLCIGEEAIAVGVCHCLAKGAKVFATYRNHGIYLAITDDTDGFFGELYGKVTGIAKGKGGSMHLAYPQFGLMATSAIVGTPIPLAVGAAFADAYRGSDAVTTVFFGDGAIEEGAFWESLNFACLKKLKVLFVCEDNGLAIHTAFADRRGFSDVKKVVEQFNCHVGVADGADLVEVIFQTRQIIGRMSEDSRPGFLLFPYYRFMAHVGAHDDFKAGYRPKPLPETMEKLDPVRCFENFLFKSGFAKETLFEIDVSVKKKIDESVGRAQSAPFPPPHELKEDVWA